MAIPKMTDDLNIIQTLSDLPNSEDGLSAEELKAKFDAAGLAVQNFINNKLIPALVAAEIPFAPTNEINAETIQAAIESVQAQVRDAASGTIVNGSVSKEKLASALLERIYGGRAWVSIDTPDSGDDMAADFPIGQIWLRPRFTVVNAATDNWAATACSVASSNHNVTITGTNTVASVSAVQHLSDIGDSGDRVFILFDITNKDADIGSMTVSINGAEALDAMNGGVHEAYLLAGGGLSVEFHVGWPSTSLADGSVTIANYTVVNTTRILRQLTDAKDMKDWAGYLREKVPFASFTSPEVLFAQTNNGVWSEIVFDALPADRGGTGLNTVSPNRYLRSTDQNNYELLSADEVARDLGALRMKTGTYTGTGSARTLDLGITPHLIHLFANTGPEAGNTFMGSGGIDQPVTLGNGGKASQLSTYSSDGGYNYYTVTVALSGSKLTFSGSHGTPFGNRSGVTYTWIAIY